MGRAEPSSALAQTVVRLEQYVSNELGIGSDVVFQHIENYNPGPIGPDCAGSSRIVTRIVTLARIVVRSPAWKHVDRARE